MNYQGAQAPATPLHVSSPQHPNAPLQFSACIAYRTQHRYSVGVGSFECCEESRVACLVDSPSQPQASGYRVPGDDGLLATCTPFQRDVVEASCWLPPSELEAVGIEYMLTACMHKVWLTCTQEAWPPEELTLFGYCADIHKAAEVCVVSCKAEEMWRAAVSTDRLV